MKREKKKRKTKKNKCVKWVWDLFGNLKKWALPSTIDGVGVASDKESSFEEVKS